MYDDLESGNQLKKDIEGKEIVNQDGTPIKGKEGADNYAHSVTDAKIAQKGVAHAAVALTGGVVKEGVDLWKKIVVPGVKGEDVDVKQVLKDSRKDMENNWRGIKWGLEHPDGDAEKHFAQLDLESNKMVKGYDNQIAQARRLTDAEKKDRQMAEALAQKQKDAARMRVEGQRAAQAAKKFEGSKVPDPKTPKKEKVQTPMAPTTPSVAVPVPAWQQKNGKSSR